MRRWGGASGRATSPASRSTRSPTMPSPTPRPSSYCGVELPGSPSPAPSPGCRMDQGSCLPDPPSEPDRTPPSVCTRGLPMAFQGASSPPRSNGTTRLSAMATRCAASPPRPLGVTWKPEAAVPAEAAPGVAAPPTPSPSSRPPATSTANSKAASSAVRASDPAAAAADAAAPPAPDPVPGDVSSRREEPPPLRRPLRRRPPGEARADPPSPSSSPPPRLPGDAADPRDDSSDRDEGACRRAPMADTAAVCAVTGGDGAPVSPSATGNSPP